MDIDVSLDYIIMDWLEPVTYYRRISDNAFNGSFSDDFSSDFNLASSNTVNNCLRREQQKSHAHSFHFDTNLIQKYTTWEVWKAETILAGFTDFNPKTGDALADSDGNVWIVQETDYDDRVTRWRLKCYEVTHGVGNL